VAHLRRQGNEQPEGGGPPTVDRRLTGSDEAQEGIARMRASYAVHSGKRQVGIVTAWSAHEAVVEYLRSRGFRNDEIVRLNGNAASWRGAIFKATAVPVAGDAGSA
jgi:hypothetical protein